MKPIERFVKSPYALLTAGVVIGAGSMALVFDMAARRPAYAQAQQLNAAPQLAASVRAEDLAALRSLDASLTSLAEFAAPSVVEIRSSTAPTARNPLGERMMPSMGSGSGFIYRPDGWIITNDHVVGGFDKVTVTLKDGRTFNGKVYRAQQTDIAVIKIDATGLPQLAVADSSKVRPGQNVMAVGAPFGLDQSATFGHVSAVGRPQGIQDRYYSDLIQTDAAINVGNSGGPLIDIEGRVIGVNTAILTQTGGSAGVGFAISSNQAKFIADKLIRDGKLTRAMIGLIPENLKEFQKKERKLDSGALVREVSPDSPAQKAGIEVGDIVLKIGTMPIRNQTDLRNAMLVIAPGTKVTVELDRAGQRKSVSVTLTEYKAPEEMPSIPPVPSMPSIPKDRMPEEYRQFFEDLKPRLRDEAEVPPIREGRARLGVSVTLINDEARRKFKIPAKTKGVVVVEVQPGSVAARAGVQPGDVITAFGGSKIESPEDLTRKVSEAKFGDSRSLSTERFSEGSRMSVTRDIRFR